MRMICPCDVEMERQPLGNWYRRCGCTRKDYISDAVPLPADIKAIHQLGGCIPRLELDVGTVQLFHYGRSK